MLKFLIKYREREKEVSIPIGFLFFLSFIASLSQGRVDVLVSMKLGCPVLARGLQVGIDMIPEGKNGKDLAKCIWD